MKTVKMIILAILSLVSITVSAADSISTRYQVIPIIKNFNEQTGNGSITLTFNVADTMQIDSIYVGYNYGNSWKISINNGNWITNTSHWLTPKELNLPVNGEFNCKETLASTSTGSGTIYVIVSHKNDTIPSDTINYSMTDNGSDGVGGTFYDAFYIVPVNYILDSVKVINISSTYQYYVGTTKLTSYKQAKTKSNTSYPCNYSAGTPTYVTSDDGANSTAYFYISPVKNIIHYIADTSDVPSGKPTNITEYHSNINIEVYPNPTTDYVNVSIPAENLVDAKIRLIDINGAIINEIPATSDVNMMDLNHVKGVYFIQVISGSDEVTKKLIVQ